MFRDGVLSPCFSFCTALQSTSYTRYFTAKINLLFIFSGERDQRLNNSYRSPYGYGFRSGPFFGAAMHGCTALTTVVVYFTRLYSSRLRMVMASLVFLYFERRDRVPRPRSSRNAQVCRSFANSALPWTTPYWGYYKRATTHFGIFC